MSLPGQPHVRFMHCIALHASRDRAVIVVGSDNDIESELRVMEFTRASEASAGINLDPFL
jgi:signal recognition particle receptor subunit beta